MTSREISRSKIGPFSLACTDPYMGIGWEYQSRISTGERHKSTTRGLLHFFLFLTVMTVRTIVIDCDLRSPLVKCHFGQ